MYNKVDLVYILKCKQKHGKYLYWQVFNTASERLLSFIPFPCLFLHIQLSEALQNGLDAEAIAVHHHQWLDSTHILPDTATLFVRTKY